MYTVMDTAHGVKIELGTFDTLEEAKAFRNEAERRISLTLNFIGKATQHTLTIEKEEGS